jgi:hypothetical protein
MRIWPNTSHHCRATTLSSSHRTGESRADSSLGGGSPAYTITARGVHGARVPLDAPLSLLKIAKATPSLPTSRGPFSPLYVCKMNACRLLDQVGRVGSKISAPWTDPELLYHRPWYHPCRFLYSCRLNKEEGAWAVGSWVGDRD